MSDEQELFNDLQKQYGWNWRNISVKDVSGIEDLILGDFRLYFLSLKINRLKPELCIERLFNRIIQKYSNKTISEIMNLKKRKKNLEHFISGD